MIPVLIVPQILMSSKQKCHRYYLLSHFFYFQNYPDYMKHQNWCKLAKIHQWCHFRNLWIGYRIYLTGDFTTQCASIATMLPDESDSVCRDIFIGLSMD